MPGDGPITDFCEREMLLDPCRRIVAELADDNVIELCAWVHEAFHHWKLAQADSNHHVRVERIAWETPGSPIVADVRLVDDVEPCECAGPLVENDVDLARRLHEASEPTFAAVVADFGLSRTFAAIGLWCEWEDKRPLRWLSASGGSGTC